MEKKINVVLFAYGFMGKSSFDGLQYSKSFNVSGLILPSKSKYYYSEINIKRLKKKIKILETDNQDKIYNFINKIKPNLVVVSTFNKILKKKFLKICEFINIHHGKLPKQKGRASINWAIINGRNQIYITLHKIVEDLDSGPIILQKKINILKSDNYQTIQKKINFFLKNNLNKILIKFLNKKNILKKNDKNKETWNCSRNPEDGLINFYQKRESVFNLIRGLKNKKFGAFCYLKEKKIIITDANIKNNINYEGIIPGRIVKIYRNGNVDCLCSDGVLTINKIMYKNKEVKPAKIIKSTRFTLLND